MERITPLNRYPSVRPREAGVGVLASCAWAASNAQAPRGRRLGFGRERVDNAARAPNIGELPRTSGAPNHRLETTCDRILGSCDRFVRRGLDLESSLSQWGYCQRRARRLESSSLALEQACFSHPV